MSIFFIDGARRRGFVVQKEREEILLLDEAGLEIERTLRTR
jgi:hypothetical protein